MRRSKIYLGDQDFEMHPSKTLFWKNEKTLIISDLKTEVNGKNGIWSDVKRKAIESNFQQLYDLVHFYEPESIYFIGNLFKVEDQYEWVRMNILMERFRNIEYHLINDDEPGKMMMGSFNKIRINELIVKGNIVISHKPLTELNGSINICGYINPCFRYKRRRLTSARCSCFVFSHNHFFLPSFNKSPAMNYFEPGNDQRIYCIKGNKIKSIKNNHSF